MTFPPVPAADQYLLGLRLRAITPAGGFALTGGTPTILTWTAPNDGKQHRAVLFGSINAAGGAAGGAISALWTDPGGDPVAPVWIAPNQGSGFGGPTNPSFSILMVKAGTTVTIQQTTALSAGTETLWAEIWGS